MIPELKISEELPVAKRIFSKDLTEARLESLRDSVIDFCKRSRSFTKPMQFWSYILSVLNGKEQADLWWVLDGNEVVSFLVMKIYQDFDGQWTAYTMFGYSKSRLGREQYQMILDDYQRKGVSRLQFTTRRNSKVFQRWLGKDWRMVGTLFEKEISNG